MKWFIERLNLDPGLTGDLLEERRRGRSRLWYGTQLSFAVLVAVRDGIWNHKLDTLRVVATGFALQYLAIFLWFLYGPRVPDLSIAQWLNQSFGVIALTTLIAWLIADRQRPLPTVTAFVVAINIWYLWLDFASPIVPDPFWCPHLLMNVLTILSETAGLLVGAALVRPRAA